MACLMAEYACGRRYVRAAATGFSPGGGTSMLREKAGRSLHFQFMLEAGARLKQTAREGGRQQMAGRFVWEEWKIRQNKSFFGEKRKKSRLLRFMPVCDCF